MEKLLKDVFGYDKFRDKQLDIINAVLEGRDVSVIMFTGAGKSLCYQYPAVYMKKTCFVISPLISLMNDQIAKLNDMGIMSCTLNSTVTNKSQLRSQIMDGEFTLVYVAPEYIVKQESFITELVDNDIIGLFAIDEAHCTSTWGNDFRESYKQLNLLRKWAPDIPIIALTATATKLVEQDIINFLKLKNPIVFKTTFDRPNLVINVKSKSKNLLNDLLPLINKNDRTIIYCQTQKETEEIASLLRKQKILSGSYHAGMPADKRKDVHNKFIAGSLMVIVATVAFGMGIDTTIRKVIHYGMPKNMESYYQEIGRAGRDGQRAECHLYYAMSDTQKNNYFINNIGDRKYREISMRLYMVMKNFIFSNNCRRAFILDYFGETYHKDNCQSCDNCMTKSEQTMQDFTEEGILLFKAMNITGNVYGATMIIDILRGSNSKKILPKYKKCEIYDKGSKHSQQWWKYFVSLVANNGIIRENSIAGGQGFTLSNTKHSIEILTSGKKLILPVPKGMSELINKTKTIKKEKEENTTEKIVPDDIKIIKTKKATIEDTLQLLNKYDDLKDVISASGLTSQTIEKHIAKLYEDRKYLNVVRFGLDDYLYGVIKKVLDNHDLNSVNISEIKSDLPRKVSYLQIRLAIVKYQKNKRNVFDIQKFLKGEYYKVNTKIDKEYVDFCSKFM